MTFVQRKIELTFQLGTGSFGLMGNNVVVLKDLRVQCSILKSNGPSLGEAHLRVFGLEPSLLNELSALNQADMAARQNRIIIKAGDDKAGMAIVFEGQIALAQIDMAGVPEVALNIQAFAGQLFALKTEDPVSYPGSADVAVILGNLAQKMGMTFENNGVSVQLATPYYAGSLMEQARRCAEDAGIEMFIDDSEPGKNTLAIWPRGGRRGGFIPLISPESGLVGYPGYSSGTMGGIAVKCVFNSQLRIGGAVRVQSDIQVANGQWLVFDISHDLDSEVPGGLWFTHFNGSPYGQ